MLDFILKIKSFYDRFERFNPILFFFGGFTWDSVTLKRIDQLLDNLILLIYLILLGLMIVLITFIDRDRIKNTLLLKYKKWYPLGLQFFLGGLFSAYVVFYFQSASFTKTSLFLGLLVLFLLANELLEKRLKNIFLILAFYFLASFSFFIFFIPVIIKVLNTMTFVLGGLLSLALVLGLIYFLNRHEIFATRTQYLQAGALILGLYFILNIFYVFNWIPPVPLSLKEGAIYHHASKNSETNLFTLKFEQPRWYQPFKNSDDEFRYADGDTVSCFTAVFAPATLKKKIYHHWQRYMPGSGEWLTTDRLGFNIIGYREGGYRGYTRKRHMAEGEWRVDVETEEGVLLGRIKFDVTAVDEKVKLKTINR